MVLVAVLAWAEHDWMLLQLEMAQTRGVAGLPLLGRGAPTLVVVVAQA